jgi:pyridoxal phosphate enzyme (YggS family)
VKQVIDNFELIHSVDTLSLAEQISKTAGVEGKRQAILLQVKMTEDPNKFGFEPDDLRESFGKLNSLANIDIRGLMTITPAGSNSDICRKCFDGLRLLREELAAKHGAHLQELSMGMTDDWREAVECGATMVRLGRAIFGN